MGKIYGWLKYLLMFFNVLLIILGVLMIAAVVKATIMNNQPQMSEFTVEGLGWFWFYIVVVFCIATLGICAGCTEKPLLLKIFAGITGVGIVIVLICGVLSVIQKNRVESAYKIMVHEMLKPLMNDRDSNLVLDLFQQQFHCCGASSLSEYGRKIPDSCECDKNGVTLFGQRDSCMSRPAGTTGPNQIYAQNCIDAMFSWVDVRFKIIISFFFTTAAIALMAMLVSIVMICRGSHHDNAGGASIAMGSY